jgi:hypothetical protein
VGTRHGKEFPLALSILKDVPILSTKWTPTTKLAMNVGLLQNWGSKGA